MVPLGAALIEFGSGSRRKARLMLRACRGLAVYVPVDISAEMLAQEAAALRADCPGLAVRPVAADFTQAFALPREAAAASVRVGFFPGSTIGNFEPPAATAFLHHAARVLGPGARLIVGVDLVKDEAVLNAAYNDAAGVTAQFNLNVLKRMNRELGGNVRLDGFAHRAFFNRERSRVEMHLMSLRRQRVAVAGRSFDFEAGETIHTESSYKYTIASFGALARGAGWSPLSAWTDADGWFSVQAFALPAQHPR
jgi:dimethylhistidine N-methyltransferase